MERLCPLLATLAALGLLLIACTKSSNPAENPGPVEQDAGLDAPQPDTDTYEQAHLCFGRETALAETAALAEDRSETRTIGERSYEIFVPAGLNLNRALPLIFNFHGATPEFIDASEIHATISEMNEAARTWGYIVVYPQALVLDGTQRWQKEASGPDVAFVDAMLEELSASFCIDPQRIYSTGFSSGAGLSYTLACVRANVFAAIAPVAGEMAIEACKPEDAVGVIAFHGTEDPRNTYANAQASVAHFVDIGSCKTPPQRVFEQGDAYCERYPDCAPGRDVTFCTMEGAGHTWPGSQQSELILTAFGEGETSMDLSANEQMHAFFEALTAVSPHVD